MDHAPKTYLLSRFVPELCRQLAEYNRKLPPAERPQRQLRLRIVVHAGEIHWDGKGYFGEALDLACRLLDAPGFKKALRSASAPAALVVSDEIFWNIVKHGYDGLRADTFHPDVRVQMAGRRRQGWVHLPPDCLGSAGAYDGSRPYPPEMHAVANTTAA